MKVPHQVEGSPFEQAFIQTSILRIFVDVAELLTETCCCKAIVGLAVGAPGIGKSASLLCYQELLARKEIPVKAISIRVSPCPTPSSLIGQLSDALGEPILAMRTASRLNDIAAAARLQDLRLMMLDESDRLNDRCLDLLCSFLDMVRCNCLLVGLPSLLQRCQKHEWLRSRVGMCVKFTPLSFEEVLYRVLPALTFPGWEFDPTREADCLLAELLWEGVSPSLRRLLIVLGNASTLAHMQHEPRITDSYIQQALQLLPSPLDRVDASGGRVKRRDTDRRDRHSSRNPQRELRREWPESTPAREVRTPDLLRS